MLSSRLAPAAVAAFVLLCVPAASVQAQARPGQLSGVVRDSAAHPLAQARVVLQPGDRIARADSAGRFRFAGLAPGSYVLEVRRIGYAPLTRVVALPDDGAAVDIVLAATPYMLAPVTVQERQLRLPRVYERQEKHLGSVLFAEDIERLGMVDVRDLLQYTVLQRQLAGTTSCGSRRYYFVDGRPLPPGTELQEYVKPWEIEAIETHRSADFIREDFLAVPNNGTLRRGPTQRFGPFSMGTPPPELGLLTGRCARVVMIWTKFYRGR